MKKKMRWISVMLAAVLMAGTLQVPALAGGNGADFAAASGADASGCGESVTADPAGTAVPAEASANGETVGTDPSVREDSTEGSVGGEMDGLDPAGQEGSAVPQEDGFSEDDSDFDGNTAPEEDEDAALEEDAASEEAADREGAQEESYQQEDAGDQTQGSAGDETEEARGADTSEVPAEDGKLPADDQEDQGGQDDPGNQEGWENQDDPGNQEGRENKDDQEEPDGQEDAESQDGIPEEQDDLIEEDLPEEAVSGTAADAVVSGLMVASRSQDEIRAFFAQNPAPYLSNTYAEEPSIQAPYSAGRLSGESQQYGLNALNQARFIAGLSADVTAKEEYISMTQAAALLNAANGSLSHYPSRPSDMDDALYDLGCSGASSSNIAWGTGSLAYSVHLWMGDSDSSNIDRLGHRRWILNPTMGQTGFGAVRAYSAVYAFDRSNQSAASVRRVAWPAQNMPLEYFDEEDAWSVSFGESVQGSTVMVLLRRQSDGKEWTFSEDQADGYFAVDNGGYGQTGCVIFRPEDISYASGDSFDVTITGAVDDAVQYTVSFFRICEGEHAYSEETVKEPTCTENGQIRRICLKCGDVKYEYPSALGHSYEVTEFKDGLVYLHCPTCDTTAVGAVPASYTAFWRDLADTESTYYYSSIPSGLEAGARLALWMPDSYITHTADADHYFDTFEVYVQEEEGSEVLRTDSNHFTLEFSEAGTYHIVIAPTYNSDAARTYVVRIVKPVGSLTLTAEPSSPQPYGTAIRLSAAADGGKGTLRYSFYLVSADGTESTLSSGSTTSEYIWNPSGAGNWQLRAEAADSGDGGSVVSSNVLSFTVEKGEVAVKDGKEVTAAGSLTYGQPVSEIQVENAAFTGVQTGETLLGTFAFSEPGKILPAGTHAVDWTFTPSDDNYRTLTGILSVTVEKAVPVIRKAPKGETSVYHPEKRLGSIALSGGEADVEGTWRWTSADIVPEAPGGSYACEFVPADENDYESVQTQAELVIGKAAPWMKEIQGGSIVYGQLLQDSALTGTAQYGSEDETPVAGTFCWADGTVKPCAKDSQATDYEAIFTPADTKNYEEVSGMVRITVEKADQPAQMPPGAISVPYATAALSDQILRDREISDWSFAQADIGRSLEAGGSLMATLLYTGADAGNYRTESVQITVSRSNCGHDGGRRTERAEDASCSKEGYSGDLYCTVCGELLQSGVVLPKTPHSWDEGRVEKAPALEEEGSRIYTCTVCGETRTEVIAKLLDIRAAALQDLDDMTYTGSAIEQPILLQYGETALVLGTDYTVSWKDHVNVGTATATVTGCGLYGGSREVSFEILPKSIKGCTVTGIADKTYDGGEQTQSVVVKSGTTVLREGTDYRIEYSDNTEIGTATVTITGIDNYTDSVSRTFEIKEPPAVAVTGLALDRTYADLAATETLQLKASVTPSDATDQTITWSSDNPAVASVDQNGVVSAIKYGKAVITARSSNGLTAKCTVQTRFNDVNDPQRMFYQPVYWAVDKGITVCTVAFRPEDSVNRGEFVAFLWRLAGKPKSSAKVSFKDVNTKTQFYDAIRWAVGKGIIKGYKDGTFKSKQSVTRGETAIMIWRYAGRPAAKTKKSPFSDIPISTLDSCKAILWGAENGIIKGSKGKFLKDDGCTRGQVVTFLYRYAQKFK